MAKKYSGVYFDEKAKTYYIKPRLINNYGNVYRPTIRNFKTAKDAYESKIKIENENKVTSSSNPSSKTTFKLNRLTLVEAQKLYIDSIKYSFDNDTIRKKNDYLMILTKRQGNMLVDSYKEKDYREFKNDLIENGYMRGQVQKKYSITYLNKLHSEIVRMFDFLIEEELVETKKNIAKKVGKFGSPKENKLESKRKVWNVITYDEYLKLMKATSDNIIYNTLFDLFFSNGPRPGELRSFRFIDYNYEKKELFVKHTISKRKVNNVHILKEPKTASSKAKIILNDELNKKIKNLKSYWEKFENYSDEWFIFGGPFPISESAIKYNRDKYFKMANIEKHLRLQDFRHSYATWLHSLGVDISIISKMMRHKDIKVTMETYTHFYQETLDETINMLNNIKNGGQNGVK